MISSGKKKKRKKAAPKDPVKESIFRGLKRVLEDNSFQVRREKLKQGHGWRASSGTCRVREDSLIFVDQRMTQDEQIEFLMGKIVPLNLDIEAEKYPELNDKLLNQLVVESVSSESMSSESMSSESMSSESVSSESVSPENVPPESASPEDEQQTVDIA